LESCEFSTVLRMHLHEKQAVQASAIGKSRTILCKVPSCREKLRANAGNRVRWPVFGGLWMMWQVFRYASCVGVTAEDIVESLFVLSDGQNPFNPTFSSDSAFAAYEHIRDLLPKARFPSSSRKVDDLGAIADQFDAFVFDAFGVLNVGDSPIPGAVNRLAALKAAGKTCVVITNAASYDRQAAIDKFTRLGFGFVPAEIVTSRKAAEEAVTAIDAGKSWAALGLDPSEAGILPFDAVFPAGEPAAYDRADGFVFLSTLRWTDERQQLLEASLGRRRRPVVVANPDIIAPREGGLSTEPGYYGYRLALMGLADPQFHGKPFPGVYDLARRGHPAIAEGRRVLMIGDTLHTDVLGGAAQGWSTALVSDHGLFKGADVTPLIAQSGIVPDFIMPRI
jgi:glycerol-1-phosphatase